MNSSTRKIIISLSLAANIVGVATIGAVMHYRHAASPVIDLGTITVTAADVTGNKVASNHVIDLGVIVVTPTDAQDRYAASLTQDGAETAEAPAIETLVQAMDALSPGQFLDNSTGIDLLGTLAFERIGR